MFRALPRTESRTPKNLEFSGLNCKDWRRPWRKVSTMNGADDFWLNLARLADSYADCGSTAAERAARALRQFESMPRVAQREILLSLRSLAYQLPDLYTISSASANRRDIFESDDTNRKDAG